MSVEQGVEALENSPSIAKLSTEPKTPDRKESDTCLNKPPEQSSKELQPELSDSKFIRIICRDGHVLRCNRDILKEFSDLDDIPLIHQIHIEEDSRNVYLLLTSLHKQKIVITTSNVVSLLSSALALSLKQRLRQQFVDFIIENICDIANTDTLKNVDSSIFDEIFATLSHNDIIWHQILRLWFEQSPSCRKFDYLNFSSKLYTLPAPKRFQEIGRPRMISVGKAPQSLKHHLKSLRRDTPTRIVFSGYVWSLDETTKKVNKLHPWTHSSSVSSQIHLMNNDSYVELCEDGSVILGKNGQPLVKHYTTCFAVVCYQWLLLLWMSDGSWIRITDTTDKYFEKVSMETMKMLGLDKLPIPPHPKSLAKLYLGTDVALLYYHSFGLYQTSLCQMQKWKLLSDQLFVDHVMPVKDFNQFLFFVRTQKCYRLLNSGDLTKQSGLKLEEQLNKATPLLNMTNVSVRVIPEISGDRHVVFAVKICDEDEVVFEKVVIPRRRAKNLSRLVYSNSMPVSSV